MGNVVVMNYGFSTSLSEREIRGMGAHSKERKKGGITTTPLCLVVIFISFGYQPCRETT